MRLFRKPYDLKQLVRRHAVTNKCAATKRALQIVVILEKSEKVF